MNSIDKQALELVDQHRNLIHWLMRRWGIYKDYEEIYAAGYYGAFIAAKKFDESKGAKFSTFAQFYIKDQIRSYLKKTHVIKHTRIKDLPVFVSLEDIELEELLYEDEVVTETCERRDLIQQHINILDEREKFIIANMYGFGTLPKTTTEIGEELNLTRVRVEQIEREALTKLRNAITISIHN